ncbi:MAG: YceI family protein [Terricaulis sp.]
MRTIALALAFFTIAAPIASAQTAQRFVLDAAHTQVSFSIERFGFNHVLGQFDAIAGEVALDQVNPERSRVNATIQTASVSAGLALRDEHLRGERWLNAAAFPTMTFNSTAVRRTGENTADVTGDMTIHGVTQPVTLHVTLNRIGTLPNNQRTGAGFSATASVSRAAFGIATAPNLIGDEIRITIEALGEVPPA